MHSVTDRQTDRRADGRQDDANSRTAKTIAIVVNMKLHYNDNSY